MTLKQLNIATNIAYEAHRNQFRRDGKTPYIEHVKSVVGRLRGQPNEVIATAWLHDVLEDSDWMPSDLEKAGICREVVHAVVTLTHTKACKYESYLQLISEEPIARTVKIADMLSNLADSPTDKQIVKYAKGLLVLMGQQPI